MINDVERILLTEEQIHQKVSEIGKRISEDYRGKNPIFVGVLKGCFIFMADLMRELDHLIDRLQEYRDALADQDEASMEALLADGARRKKELDG